MQTPSDISALFTPFAIKKVVLPNRFVMPGMQRGWNDAGAPRSMLADYYRRRVEGGVGLIISESVAVDHPTATAQPAAAKLNADTVGAWARCVEEVNRAGGHMLLQLWHEGGGRNHADGLTRSPSGFGRPGKPNGSAFTAAELAQVTEAYVQGAALAKSIGATGVEVHAAHGYMMDQFLWPATNRREDGYGGDDILQRARFPAEVVAGIRRECGADFLISFRFSQWKESDFTARIAPTPDDLKLLLDTLKAAGVDLLHASTRRFWLAEWPGDDRGLAGWTRALSGIPTITVGSVGLNKDVMQSFEEKEEAEQVASQAMLEIARRFAAGEFDLVSVGRSLISDPDWVNKIREQRYADIRPFRKADIDSLEWEAHE
jgi:2,4-dienoyl-CoA reductase-like NADH-dependent reductase (Old Yellow Enzyme family)